MIFFWIFVSACRAGTTVWKFVLWNVFLCIDIVLNCICCRTMYVDSSSVPNHIHENINYKHNSKLHIKFSEFGANSRCCWGGIYTSKIHWYSIKSTTGNIVPKISKTAIHYLQFLEIRTADHTACKPPGELQDLVTWLAILPMRLQAVSSPKDRGHWVWNGH